MASFKEMLGNKLLKKGDGETKTIETESICGKEGVIALYFSAHWCPPCRGFTPALGDFYKKFKEKHSDKHLEIVFISSDRDEDAFKEYFAEMPFLALPYEERDKKAQLSKQFKVSGIPSLVFLEADTGKLVTKNGRACVMDDPEGDQYPWKPKSLTEIFAVAPGTVLGQGGQSTPAADVIKDKVIGLYFSAHWCPPCRSFTPVLTDVYKKVKADGKNFEIIFVSSDRSEEMFNEYFGEMPWHALPFGDPRKKLLSEYFTIEGIPALVILNENLEVIQKNGRGAISNDKEGKEFPWPAKPVNKLDANNAGVINEGPTLIYFCGDGKQQAANDLCYPIAEKFQQDFKAGKAGTEELFFTYEDDEDPDIAESVRMFFKLGDTPELVVIVDASSNKKYVLPDGEVTKERLEQLVEDFKNKKLEFVSFR